jgi:hypothetical protein
LSEGFCGLLSFSPFTLTETVLLGTIAGKKLDWDSTSMKVTNLEAANQFVHHPYLKGWEVTGLSG